jgi:hypothetical protein
VETSLKKIEKITKKEFGSVKNPLLVPYAPARALPCLV